MGGKVPAGYPNPFDIAKRAKVNFDSNLSEERYNLVSSLFDQTIATFDDDGGAYNQADAGGFIKLNALRMRIEGKLQRR